METSRRTISKTEYCAFALLLLIAGVAYVSRLNRVVRQADPAAYYYAGLAIAEVGSPRFCDENNTAAGPYFTLLGFTVRSHSTDPCFYTKYSIGLPVLIALTRLLVPIPEAVSYLSPMLGLIGVAALFALGQVLFDRPTGLLAAGLLALSPRYWYGATEMWSDVPALAFLLIGTLLVVRMIDRDDLLQGLLGGMTFGYACLIRYPLLMALLPFTLYFLCATRGRPKPKRGLAAFTLGLGFVALTILSYNKLIYGGFLTTGYSTEHGFVPWPAFSVSHFFGQSPVDAQSGYRTVAATLVENFYFVGLLLAIAAVAIMPRAKALLIGSFVGLFCVLYSFYFRSITGVNARHLLPAFAMIYLAIAFGVVRVLRLLTRRQELALVAAVPLIVAAWHFPSIDSSLVQLGRRNQRTETRVALVREFTEPTEADAVFISREYHDLIILYGQRSALNYTMFAKADPLSRTYDLSDYERKLVETVSKLLESDTPVYIVVEPDTRSFRQGPVDPYPILSAHFRLRAFRTDPAIHQVLMPDGAQTEYLSYTEILTGQQCDRVTARVSHPGGARCRPG